MRTTHTVKTPDRAPVGVVVDGYSAGKFLPPAFRRLGADVLHLQSTPEFLSTVAPPDLGPYLANVVHDDLERTAKQLAEYAPVCVLPGQETGVMPADLIAEHMGLPGNGSALSVARRDKYEMIETLRRAGIHCAHQLKSSDTEEIVAWAAREAGYPVVLKPLSSASTDGVFICRDADDIRTAAGSVLGSYDIFERRNTEVLAQSLLHGTEYIVDVVRGPGGGRHVCGVWEYEKTDIGTKRVYDKDLLLAPDSEPVAELVGYLDTVLEALEIRFGAAHAEIIMTPQGPALVEIGARVNGNMDPGFHDACMDGNQVDLLALACVRPDEYARRFTGNTMYRKRREALVYHGQTSLSGVVAEIDEGVLAEIGALDTVHLAVPRAAPGDRLRPTSDLLSSPLRVFMTGDDRRQLTADHQRILALKDAVFRLV
ncbi:ATP-grasp domain-containing protein [Streptomyces sp. NPDC050636]|uniref:ATP-grasp domain-containing protein n=1 Tax=Streptomyces sp. NPDC050636 TaxID=3154510 RepID=UPI003440234C